MTFHSWTSACRCWTRVCDVGPLAVFPAHHMHARLDWGLTRWWRVHSLDPRLLKTISHESDWMWALVVIHECETSSITLHKPLWVYNLVYVTLTSQSPIQDDKFRFKIVGDTCPHHNASPLYGFPFENVAVSISLLYTPPNPCSSVDTRGGWVWRRCRVSYVTGVSNWYWLTVGQGLLSL